MAALTIARTTIFGTFHNWRLWLIQFIGNPALFLLFVVWLNIPESTTWFVLAELLLAIVLISAIVLIHGGTLNYFSEKPTNEFVAIKPASLRALKNILPMLICAAAASLLWMLMDKFDSLDERIPTYLRSTLSAGVRKHISLSSLENMFDAIAFALRWILIPGLILPFAAAASNLGFRGLGPSGFRRWKNAICSFSYWIVLTFASVVGVFATEKLIDLTPNFAKSTYGYEWFSLIMRLVIAYALALIAWMTTCSLIGHYASVRATPGADVGGKPGA